MKKLLLIFLIITANKYLYAEEIKEDGFIDSIMFIQAPVDFQKSESWAFEAGLSLLVQKDKGYIESQPSMREDINKLYSGYASLGVVKKLGKSLQLGISNRSWFSTHAHLRFVESSIGDFYISGKYEYFRSEYDNYAFGLFYYSRKLLNNSNLKLLTSIQYLNNHRYAVFQQYKDGTLFGAITENKINEVQLQEKSTLIMIGLNYHSKNNIFWNISYGLNIDPSISVKQTQVANTVADPGKSQVISLRIGLTL